MNGSGTKGQGIGEEAKKKILEQGPEKVQQILAEMFGGENKNPRDILFRMTKKAKEEASRLIYDEVPMENGEEQVLAFTAEAESVTIFRLENSFNYAGYGVFSGRMRYMAEEQRLEKLQNV